MCEELTPSSHIRMSSHCLCQTHHAQASGTPEDEAAAVALVRDYKAQRTIAAFSAGQQVPKRNYTIEELRLNNVEPEKYDTV